MFAGGWCKEFRIVGGDGGRWLVLLGAFELELVKPGGEEADQGWGAGLGGWWGDCEEELDVLYFFELSVEWIVVGHDC